MQATGIRRKYRHLDLPRAVAAPVFRQDAEFLTTVFFYKKRHLDLAAQQEIKMTVLLRDSVILKCWHLGRAIIPRASALPTDFLAAAAFMQTSGLYLR